MQTGSLSTGEGNREFERSLDNRELQISLGYTEDSNSESPNCFV